MQPYNLHLARYSEGSNSFALGTEHNNLTDKESSGVIVLHAY